MKAELLRAGFCQQSLENTKADLEQKLTDKDKTVLELRVSWPNYYTVLQQSIALHIYTGYILQVLFESF